jgi:N-acetylglucosamine-6-sulfatase
MSSLSAGTPVVRGPRRVGRCRRAGARTGVVALVAAALVVSLGAALVGHSTTLVGAAAETRPNVVFIMVDDMREDDLRFLPLTRRRLGERGVTFTNALSPHPLCCPARASVLTGWYTHNHRVFSNKGGFGFPSFPDRSTIATWLRRSGYATIYLGKYLNGYGELPEPGKTSGNSVHYVPPGWTQWRGSIDGGLPETHWANGSTYRYFDTTLNVDGERFENYNGQYQSDVYGRLAARIIQRRSGSEKPFFLYVSYTAPHTGRPIEADDPGFVTRSDGNVHLFATAARPKRVVGMFDAVIPRAPGVGWDPSLATDKPNYLRTILPLNRAEKRALRTVTRQRAEALAVVDRQVNRTLDALAETRELDKTLLIFTSDNGYLLGEQGIRQGKRLPHEPSLSVPLLMRGPGIPAGEVRHDPFLSIDFASTIAAATRTPLGHEVDGINMLDIARRGDQGWTRPVLTATGPGEAVRQTDEAGEPLDARDPGARDLRWAVGIRTSRYLYVDLATGEEELYDLRTDPAQYHNLSAQPGYEAVRDLLREELKRVRACDGTVCQTPLPPELESTPR